VRLNHLEGSHGEEEQRERLMGSSCGAKHLSSPNLQLGKRLEYYTAVGVIIHGNYHAI